MELLPQNKLEFTEQEYWEQFFQLREQKAFEWYLSSQQLIPYLTTYIQGHDINILHLGTGNSDLPIVLYDQLEVKSQMAVDFSEGVIEEMASKTIDMNGLEFKVVDVLKMDQDYELGKFHLVIDKGLFDAMMPEEDQEKANVLFEQIRGVLFSNDSLLIVVSLLQDHVLRLLYRVATESYWNMRIIAEEIRDAESPLRPFVIEFRPNENNESEVTFEDVVYSDFETLEQQIIESQLEFKDYVAKKKKEASLVWVAEIHLKPATIDIDVHEFLQQFLDDFNHTEVISIQHSEVVPVAFGLEKVVVEMLLRSTCDADMLCTTIWETYETSLGGVDLVELTQGRIHIDLQE